jgi:hypothetical protein
MTGKWSTKQIAAALRLLQDPERIMAMGLGPAVIAAARKAGWAPPETAPKPSPKAEAKSAPGHERQNAGAGDNVIDLGARRRAKLNFETSCPMFDFGDLALAGARFIERSARLPADSPMGQWGRSLLPSVLPTLAADGERK